MTEEQNQGVDQELEPGVEKLTLVELRANTNWEEAVIVITEDTFNQPYSLESRSYEVSREAKYFNPNMAGVALLANSLDGQDQLIRLDMYLRDTEHPWKVDYCYITK